MFALPSMCLYLHLDFILLYHTGKTRTFLIDVELPVGLEACTYDGGSGELFLELR